MDANQGDRCISTTSSIEENPLGEEEDFSHEEPEVTGEIDVDELAASSLRAPTATSWNSLSQNANKSLGNNEHTAYEEKKSRGYLPYTVSASDTTDEKAPDAKSPYDIQEKVAPSYLRYTASESALVDKIPLPINATQQTAVAPQSPLDDPMPLPPLTRATRPPTQPGAFAQAGLNRAESSSAFTIYYSTSTTEVAPGDIQQNTRPNTSGLVQANLVSASRQFGLEDLEVAEPIHEDEGQAPNMERKTRIPKKTLLGMLILVATVVVVVIYFGTRESSSSNRTTQQSTSHNATSSTPDPTLEPFLALLPDTTISIIQSDPNTTQPQSKAYHWVLNDPNMTNYTNERLLQRFVLATFYYSTNGEGWNQKGGETILMERGTMLGPHGGGGSGNGRPQGQGGAGGSNGRPQGQGGDSGPNGGVPQGNGGGGGTRSGSNGSGGQQESASRQGGGSPSRGGIAQFFCPQAACNVTFGQWMDYESHECTWYNTERMCWENKMVHSLALIQNRVSGNLPEELGLLSSLKRLALHTNMIVGSIPTTIGKITELQQVLIGSNQFTGTVPSEIGLLSNSLISVDVVKNALKGTLPVQLWGLSNLKNFMISGNQLSGSLPENMGDLVPKLNDAHLGDTLLSGSLPSSLGNCTSLSDFSVKNSQLTGSLPKELGLLSRLGRFDASSTNISGSLPSELGQLQRLKWLYVQENMGLTGTIPEEWNTLNLRTLSVEETSLTGTIPTSLCDIQGLSFDCSALCGCGDCSCAPSKV